LNDFLPDERKQISFEETFKTPVTVLETIISFLMCSIIANHAIRYSGKAPILNEWKNTSGN
jgi:hypothetical protein